jgi:sterol desaturase/sphingolipid hydroxylase (fatty acid hydroxylase superfamily)
MVLIFLFAIIVLELIFPIQKMRFLRAGFISDFAWHFVIQSSLLDLCLIRFLDQFTHTHSLHLFSDKPIYMQFILGFIIIEFLNYWLHRFIHNSRLMWRFHEVHHSSTELNWLSGVRAHPIDGIIFAILNAVVFCAIGSDFSVAVMIGTIEGVHGMYKHANFKNNIGFLRYIIVSTEMHRCHHISEMKYQQANYGNTLSVFDWIFGTAILPPKEEYKNITYGIDANYPQTFFKQLIHVFRRID